MPINMKIPARLQAYCRPQNAALTAFFLVGFYYLWFIITYGLTDVYVYREQFYREYGFYLSWLNFPGSKSFADFFFKFRQFSERAMVSGGFAHSHGALQFILFNLYLSGLVRDHFPVFPKVVAFGMQFVPACLTMVYAWLLGQQFESRRFAYIFVAALVLAPGMPGILRWDTMYILLTLLAHLMVFYHWSAFIQNPERPLNRLMAPLSLGIYLTTGMEWPNFCFWLVLYLFLCRKLKVSLLNRYMIIPIMIFGAQFMFFISLYLIDANRTYGFERWKYLYVSFPLAKLFIPSTFIPISMNAIRDYLLCSFGIAWFVAIFVALVVVFCAAKKVFEERAINLDTRQSFQIVLSCWLLVFSYPFLKSYAAQVRVAHSFCLTLPVIYLATLPFARETRLPVWDWAKSVIFLGIMVLLQWPVGLMKNESTEHFPLRLKYFGNDIKIYNAFNDDHRIYAVAGYLISARPDLLKADKRALLPGDNGDNSPTHTPGYILFFTAGRYEYVHAGYNPFQHNNIPEGIYWFLQSKGWGNDNILQHINWILLPTEGITQIPGEQAKDMNAEYYEKLLHDPRIDWIGRFANSKGAKGKEMFLGEVRLENVGGNRDVDHAPALEVEPLARLYNEKYNRVSYLRQNLDIRIALDW